MTKSETKENLDELKENLWKKIVILESRLKEPTDKEDDYRKVLDMYHKIVKSYLDIVKVQRYAPGSSTDEELKNQLLALLQKISDKELLAPVEKKTLLHFKRFMDEISDEESKSEVSGI